MCTNDITQLNQVCKFIEIVLKKVKQPPGNTFISILQPPSILLEKYFRFEISLLSILCMLIARMKMGTSRVSADSDIIT